MAIAVEQEKKQINWVSALLVIIIIAVLFFGTYYLFFKKPELIDIVSPHSLQDVGRISQVSFDPQGVLESPTFQLLRRYGADLTLPTTGKSNPFQP